ncbi:hypothetical protein IH574_01325, partial [Candidatus Bathyarchaeota archaeon]|nr:hypothetical protein [Candidatus Bathyarchaeota archaeon]
MNYAKRYKTSLLSRGLSFSELQSQIREYDQLPPEGYKADIKTMNLFNIRYILEKEARRIYSFYNEDTRKSLFPMTIALHNLGIIDRTAFDSLGEVSAITNRAIHGEPINEKQYTWAYDVGFN